MDKKEIIKQLVPIAGWLRDFYKEFTNPPNSLIVNFYMEGKFGSILAYEGYQLSSIYVVSLGLEALVN